MKYELIKTYPGSPKLNTIINFGDIDCDFTHNPENYPEFWEEVVEKDYEILSYSDNNNNIFREKDNQGILHRLDFKIHSVKRLSDFEIFTIGDIVKCEDCKGKITSLEIYHNDIYLTGIDNKMPFGFTLCNALDCFEIPQKAKQPLFTTEDSVDIFKGDKIYFINTTNGRFNINICLDVELYKTHLLYFSTKEKAEEYILYNKPLLTLKDIDELLCKNTSSYFLEKFKKRAQKLNNKN